jgi:ribosomal protein S18 acetylase RimI-like enzyme
MTEWKRERSYLTDQPSQVIMFSPFTIDAYDRVIALWEQSDGVGLSSADSRESIQVYLERNPGMSFIAEQAGTLVGAVLCGHDGRRGYIHHLAVRPDCRRQGIGRKLVEKCLAALQEIGISKCHLFIFNQNLAGIRFWENIGWTRRSDIGVISKIIE